MPQTVLVTGLLAQKSLLRVLKECPKEIDYRIECLPIKVAAFLNEKSLLNHLNTSDAERIILPGLCKVDVIKLSEKLRIPVELGPKDVFDLPLFFGRAASNKSYGDYNMKIVAEIVDAPLLDTAGIVERAVYYHKCGAEVVDIGCQSGVPFPHLAETVSTLVSKGFNISIDTFSPDEMRTAVGAGARLIVSINSDNLALALELGVPVVAVPDESGRLDTLYKTIDILVKHDIPVLADPILQPLNFGFVESILRYKEVSDRYPGVPLFMGIGNVSELTEADSTGVNALLVGIAQELGISYLLTTEVSDHTWGSVREVDTARRLMHYSKEFGMVPKDVDSRLTALKERHVRRFSIEELQDIRAAIKDSNFRIFAGDDKVFVLNKSIFLSGTDVYELFKAMPETDPSHAYYLGCELSKAVLAVKLRKKYIQDDDLNWGLYGGSAQ